MVEGADNATLLVGKIRDAVRGIARIRTPDLKTPVLLLGVPGWTEAADVSNALVHVGVTGRPVGVRKNTSCRGNYVARILVPHRDAIKLAVSKTARVN